jgi:hypothetical protein
MPDPTRSIRVLICLFTSWTCWFLFADQACLGGVGSAFLGGLFIRIAFLTIMATMLMLEPKEWGEVYDHPAMRALTFLGAIISISVALIAHPATVVLSGVMGTLVASWIMSLIMAAALPSR